MKYLAFLSLFAGLLMPLHAIAVETIRFVSDEWVGYSQKDGKGYYLELLKAIFPPPEYRIEQTIVPYERAMHQIESKTADVSASASPGSVEDALYSADVTDLDVIDAAVFKGSFPDWKGIESLKDKTVVAKIGYEFSEYTQIPMRYSEKPNLEGMLQMLLAHRVDAVLDYKKDIDKAITNVNRKDDIELKLGVLHGDLYFVFANSPMGKRLKARFDQEFPKLKASGELKRIFMSTVKEERFFPQ